MVVSKTRSKLCSAPSGSAISLENLSVSSAREHLGITDEDISLHIHFPVELAEELGKCRKSPFDVWYMKGEVWPSHAFTPARIGNIELKFEDESSSEELSDFDMPSPASPINSHSHNRRGTVRSPLAKRESFLQEAWERKRELYLKQELANLKERANVRTLGRSVSDCTKPMKGIFDRIKHAVLERSMSDCSKPKEDPLITPNGLRRTHTRSLTDDDFEELKGFLDLGFRFNQSSIPDLCDTLPALEVVCAVSHNFQESLTASPVQSPIPSPTTSWRVSNPGDDPEEVREKLRHWAQAVACSARLCC